MNNKFKIVSILLILGIVGGIAGVGANTEHKTTGYYYTSENATFNGQDTDIYCNSGDQVISGGGDAGLHALVGGVYQSGPGVLRVSVQIAPNVWRVSSMTLTGVNAQTQSPRAICYHSNNNQ